MPIEDGALRTVIPSVRAATASHDEDSLKRSPRNRLGASAASATAAAACVVGLIAGSRSTFGGRAASAANATVFIRLEGSAHIEVQLVDGTKQTADLDRVEIGSGSGFVISPYGYVLTNHHVISGEDLVTTKNNRRIRLTLKVSRIEVGFPPEAAAANGLSVARFDATVYASDPTHDLAVLFISASDLPYVALGDSDAVSVGLPVNALGYPFGRDVEVGQTTAPDLVPEVSTSAGTVSAFRAGDTGERRYLQISSSVNLGNSGGPVVDRDGYAVGVIRSRLAGSEGIGFAVPIELVKDFLDSHGLDRMMPTRRLRSGPMHNLEGKGVRIHLPEGLADASRFRVRVETPNGPDDVALRIDRVLSSLTPKQIEQRLVGSETFETMTMSENQSRAVARPAGGPLLLGHAAGVTADGGREMRIHYAILDLGAEKLIARYVGPAETMAFNEAVLRGSLASLEAERLLTSDLDAIDRIAWPASDTQGRVPLPVGWVMEQAAPTRCTGVPTATAIVSASPPSDFSVTLRAALWSAAAFSGDEAASACAPNRGSLGRPSYVARVDWLGVPYAIEGVFVPLARDQMLQLEIISPDRKAALARELLAVWARKAAQP